MLGPSSRKEAADLRRRLYSITTFPPSGVGARRRAFTIVDLMVSIAVMTALVAVLLPSLGGVRDAARRTQSASDMRQIGLGLQMFAFDNGGRPPRSVFSGAESSSPVFAPAQTVHLRVDQMIPVFRDGGRALDDRWDGLGLLYAQEFLAEPSLFYSPSHRGEFTLDAFADRFDDAPGAIVGNYQYRILGQRDFLANLPPKLTLIADAMRSRGEYNHADGNNMLKADLSVKWYADADGSLLGSLASSPFDDDADDAVIDAWEALDLELPLTEVRHNGGGGGDTDTTRDRDETTGSIYR